MLVVSSGMPRSGTGWIFSVTNDLLVAAGHADAAAVRRRFLLQWLLAEHNNRLKKPNAWKMAVLDVPTRFGVTWAIKTHSRPRPSMKKLVARGRARMHYSFRDPRDVVISTWEAAERFRQWGKKGVFARLTTIPMVIDTVARRCREWEQWMKFEPALKIRFEDFKADTFGQTRMLAAFHQLAVSDEQVRTIVAKYAGQDVGRGAHKRSGKSGRYREKLGDEHLTLMREKLDPWVVKMGYELE